MKCELIDHPVYGQCAVAAKDIKAGEIVIDEPPLLLIAYDSNAAASSPPSTTEAYQRKRAFMTLSRPAKVSLRIAQTDEKLRNIILSGCYVPKVTKAVKKSIAYKAADRGVLELRKRRVVFPEIAEFSDVQLISYSLLASANAHSFSEESIALLETGCKVTHTCFNPNVAVSTRPYTKSGPTTSQEPTAKHIALRDIKKGELLLGSYAKLINATQSERKKYLMNNKMFTCQCKYCTEPDYTRGAYCPACADPESQEEREHAVAPKATLYRVRADDKECWRCQNCRSERSDEAILHSWTSGDEGNSYEVIMTSQLKELEEDCETPVLQKFEMAIEAYTLALKTFGWRHTLTAQAALGILDTATKAIDVSQSPDDSQIGQVLHYVETLPPRLEAWYIHLGMLDATDELIPLLLLMSEQLMTLSSLRHDIIPQAMALVQSLLLRARPVIEERRSWQIGHVMEEYYDELITTLNDLVNGTADGMEDRLVEDADSLINGTDRTGFE